MRLIDADALKVDWYDDYETEDGDEYSYAYVSKYQIDDAPTIDAVPVVRCKECENWDTDWETGDEPATHFCAMVALRTRGDWFCADGERKAEP